MTRARKVMFYSAMLVIPFVAVNILAAVVIFVKTGTNPFDARALLEQKKSYIRYEQPRFFPHPYIGQGLATNVPVKTLIPTPEPLLAANPEVDTIGRVRVLILGGSVAYHMSGNTDQPDQQVDGVTITRAGIFSRVLNEAFDTDRFVVYNAAFPGGKQPQQLFKLMYLDFLGARFDIVINVDGFNEIALPIGDNMPDATHLHYPRSFTSLLASLSVSTSCVKRSNAYAESYNFLPVVELVKMIYVYKCVHSIEVSPASTRDNYSSLTRFETRDVKEYHRELPLIWGRSSERIDAWSAVGGFDYIHVLQPNQYLKGSKPLTDEEKARFVADETYRFRKAIEDYYPLLDMAGLKVRHKLDLRYVFRDEQRTLYRDECCHLNNTGIYLFSKAIVSGKRELFQKHLAARKLAS